MLDPAPNEYASVYTASLISALVCVLRALLFLARKGRAALVLMGAHARAAVVLDAPWLALAIALPLLVSVRVWKSEGA